MKAIGKAACHNALNTLVPAFAANHNHAPTIVSSLYLRRGFFGELRLDIAALLIYCLELLSEVRSMHSIGCKQQIECKRGIGHTSSSVQTRNKREGQGIGRDSCKVDARHGCERHIARTRCSAHLRYAIGHQSAILGRQKHHVRDRAQCRQLCICTPQFGLARTLAKNLHELECNTSTC